MVRLNKIVILILTLVGLNGCGSDYTDNASLDTNDSSQDRRTSYKTSKIMPAQATMGPSGQFLSWDIDKDGNADALTDGLLILRHGFGIRGEALFNGAISSSSALSSAQVQTQLEDTQAIIDVDANGEVDALTDGLIILRYLFGITGNTLIDGAVATNATRSSAAEITQHLIDHMPGAETGLPETLIINEAASSNSTYEDEDGDSPDWFELFNNKSTAIDLTGWSITDDVAVPAKWVFPQIELAAGDYLRVWASDKDRSTGGVFKTLVNQGDNFRYLVPSSNPPSSWKSLTYNDSSWQQGISGFGYSDGDDATEIPSGSSSVYVRILFNVDNLAIMDQLWLDIDFDDGFVAYINGTEIARSNIIGDSPSFDSVTITDREARMYQSGSPVRFPINDFQNLLKSGNNVLSIQVHNHNANSSDLTLIPFLSAYYFGSTSDGVPPPSILGFSDPSLHTNFKLSSKGDALTLFDNNGNQMGFLDVTGLSTDNSIGRSPADGSIVFYESPSPGEENTQSGFSGIIENEIVFSHDGGEFTGQNVSLSGAGESEEIRYTLNATIPTPLSPIYSSPININGNTVVRAKIFRNNFIPSRTESRTYITSDTHALPIVTLISEPDNFFDQQEGIYVYGPQENYENALPFFGSNFWQDWERDIHFSFYEPTGELGVAIDAGVKIFGAWSRANDQRSLAIFARGRYGFSKLKYPIFPQLDYDSFESIVLRSSGNDWMRTNIKDVIATSLMDGSSLETQAHRSAVVYINGQYWGFYNIREKVNEHFLDDKINVDKSEINILTANGEVVEGSNDTYNELINSVSNNTLAVQSNYDFVASQIDIDNLITYQIANIYLDNTDWPGNNIKFWNSPETKWRWIMYDTDFSFGRPWESAPFYDNDSLSFALNANGPGWPNPPWSTLLVRKLMENTGFKNQFINQFADEMNGRFKADNVRQHINAIADSVAPEITQHFQHWSNWNNRSDYWRNQGMLSSYFEWQAEVNKIIEFTNNRIPALSSHFRSYFGISGTFPLTVQINNTDAGSIVLNSLTLTSTSWQGEYFDNVPVTLKAIPNEGFVFSHWQGSINETNPQIQLSRTFTTSVQAVFLAE